MKNWDQLLEQAEITLNLQRPSRLNPSIPTYAQLNSEFGSSRTPTAPPGIRTIVHDKPHNRGKWDPHGHKGCYVRPAILHYRCLASSIPKTAKVQVSDTTSFPPATPPSTIISSEDTATHASSELIYELIKPTPTIPLKIIGNKQTAALKHIAEVFNMATTPQERPPHKSGPQKKNTSKPSMRLNTP